MQHDARLLSRESLLQGTRRAAMGKGGGSCLSSDAAAPNKLDAKPDAHTSAPPPVQAPQPAPNANGAPAPKPVALASAAAVPVQAQPTRVVTSSSKVTVILARAEFLAAVRIHTASERVNNCSER